MRKHAAAALALVAACSRRSDDATADAHSPSQPSAQADAATMSASASLSAPAQLHAPAAPPPPPATAEATRIALARIEREPLLRSQIAVLRDHFGAGANGPFLLQRVDLVGGRMAALVARADESDPIVLVLDRDQLAWSKPRPTAGIVPPVLHASIAPRPDGGVALFVYVATMRLLAARMWADDGNPFAEIELGTFDACGALSAAYAPARGWLIACSSPNGTRAQRLREDGMTAWGRDGASLGVASTVGSPALAFDTSSSFLLAERARAVGGDRLLAFRFDDDAHPLWPGAVELGVAGGGQADRLRATLVRPGAVRVESSGNVVEVGSNGDVRRVGR
jgi:hypothetical protein